MFHGPHAVCDSGVGKVTFIFLCGHLSFKLGISEVHSKLHNSSRDWVEHTNARHIANVSGSVSFHTAEKESRGELPNANHTAATIQHIETLTGNIFAMDFDNTSFFNISLTLLDRISCPKPREPRKMTNMLQISFLIWNIKRVPLILYRNTGKKRGKAILSSMHLLRVNKVIIPKQLMILSIT